MTSLRSLLTLLFLASLFTPAHGQDAGWKLLPNSPASPLHRHEDLSFPSPDTGWVVNLRGQIHRTVDGGQTWALQLEAKKKSGSAVWFRSTGFANGRIGWAGSLTPENLLYETRDGGVTWTDITQRVSGPNMAGICGIWVVSEQVIYGVGIFEGPAQLIKSIDGGMTWTVKNMGAYAGTLVDVFFWDENNGFAVGGTVSNLRDASAVVLATTDGGETWSVRHTSSGIGEWGWKISFPTPEVGYVSVERSEGARVLKTTDGGLSWQEIDIEDSRALQGVGFLTPDLGWTSGRGTTSITTDGGTTWAIAPLDTLSRNINRFRMFGDSLGYAVGKKVYKYEAARATNLIPPPPTPLSFSLDQNYPNPFNPVTTITYTLQQQERVVLTVYNALGQEVKTLINQEQAPGVYIARWNGRSTAGHAQPSGLYLYRLTAGLNHQTRTMSLLR